MIRPRALAVAGIVVIALIVGTVAVVSRQSSSSDRKPAETVNDARASYTVVNSQTQLEQLQTTQKTSVTTPRVDWTKQKLIAVTYRAPSTGYSIVSATYGQQHNEIKLLVRQPAKGCIQLQVVTPIISFVTVDRSVGSITLNTQLQDNTQDCHV